MQQISSYKLRETLGVGGMGKVFRALTESGEEVAIKTLRVDEPHLREGYRREVEALAALDHPGVVNIVDHGLEPEPWYAMQLIRGTALSNLVEERSDIARPQTDEWWTRTLVDETPAWISSSSETTLGPESRRGTPLACDAIIQIGLTLSEALAHLHENGIVHRDLKPANIMIEPDGNAVIVDFGISSWSAGGIGRERLEAKHGAAGSLPWMSPEQIRGEWVSPRADLYSLGCVLYQMATGRRVFEARSGMAMRLKHLDEDPVSLSELRPDLDVELVDLVMQLLSKDPDDRPGYAYDVAARLSKLAGEESSFDARLTLHRPRHVGRGRTLSELVSTIEPGSTDHVIRLTGPSGVGKTRMLIEATQIWSRDCLLESLICREGITNALADRLQLPADKSSFASSVEDLLESLAQHGTPVLIIDDAHHADPTTLETIRYLTASRSESPWFVVVSYAGEAANPTLDRIDGPLFELQRLQKSDLGRLAASMLGHDAPEDLVDFLVEASEGHPYFAAETLRTLLAEGFLERDFDEGCWRMRVRDQSWSSLPHVETLSTLLARRLEVLDPAALELVDLASVLGDQCPGRWLEVMAPELVRHVAETRSAEVLSFDGEGRLVFAHRRLREVAYERMPRERRIALHRTAAERLEPLFETTQLASHLLASEQFEAAAEAYRKAAAELALVDAAAYARAMKKVLECVEKSSAGIDPGEAIATASALIDAGMFDEADRILRAIEPDDGDLRAMQLLKRAEVAYSTSNHSHGLECIDSLLELDRVESIIGEGLLVRGQILATMARYEEALESLRSALDLLRGELDSTFELRPDASELELRILVEASTTMTSLGKRTEPRALLESLIDEYDRRGNRRGMCYAVFAIVPLIALARDAEFFGHYESLALELAAEIKDQRAEARALDMMGSSFLLRGQHDRALPWYRRSIELSRRLGLRSRQMRSLANLAMACSELGRNIEAEEYFRKALGLAREAGQIDTEINALINLGSCLADLDRADEARQSLERAAELAREARYQQQLATVLIDLAELERTEGNLEAALRAVDESIELCERFELTSDVWGWLEKAQILTDSEAFAEASALVDRVEKAAERLEGPVARAFVLQAKIELLLAQGENADEWIKEAREIAGRLSGPRRIVDKLERFELSDE